MAPAGSSFRGGDSPGKACGSGLGSSGSGSSGGSDRLRGSGNDSMAGRYCVVTGANSGIGLEVTRGLMRRGAHVVMACRNPAACEAAASRLKEEGLPGSCACRVVDLEDFGAVRAFAAQQAEELRSGVQPAAAAAATPAARSSGVGGGGHTEGNGGGDGGGTTGGGGATGGAGGYRHIDVLVNNAGVMGAPPGPDGTDRHLTANHLGPYLLTRLLLPHMTHGSRIVNVASRAHFGGKLTLRTGPTGREEIVGNVRHWWFQYARSKLCNVLFTAELQRRYGGVQRAYGSSIAAGGTAGGGGGGTAGGPAHDSPGGGVGAYAVSPGLVDTGIFRHLLPSWAQWLRSPLRPLFRTPQQGAEVVLYAACSLELQGRAPLFLHDCREMQPSAAARDPVLAVDLWRVSAALVGLPPEDDAGKA